ncbi:MAG: carboxylesterase family protein [Candidatus Thiodiazotropha sp.]
MAFLVGALIILIVISECAVSEDVTVVTSLGNIIGEVETLTFDGTQFNITKFLGIPFAEPPTGSRRFNKPVKKNSLNGNFIAKTMPPTCVQNSASLLQIGIDPDSLNQSEDCLYLNVYIPGSGPVDTLRNLAVMIWIYGGGFQWGYQDFFEGKNLVGLNDVILVTFNYRVSFLGFLSTSEDNRSGNYGLWDQHTVIQWVYDHIRNFGGDPMRVTLFGESAGAASVVYQALYDGNEGFFQRVIAQSGSVNTPWAYETNPGSVYMNFANKTDCLRGSQLEILNCLRNLNITQIKDSVGSSDNFLPVKDGHFVTMRPPDLFKNASTEAWELLRHMGKRDFIFGVTSSEGGMFLNYFDRYINTSDATKPIGYSRELFEKNIIAIALATYKLKDSRALRTALIHQYGEWTNPEDEVTILQKTVDMFSDAQFNAGAVRSAMVHSATTEEGRLYFYVFDHKGVMADSRLTGASHADDVPFVLGFPAAFVALYTMAGLNISQAEFSLSRKVMEYWTNFAKTG